MQLIESGASMTLLKVGYDVIVVSAEQVQEMYRD
jgi:hypothetical protein